MHFLVLFVLAGYFHVLQTQARSEDISVTRHSDGDIFTIEESYREACVVLSSGTASPFSYASSSPKDFQVSNNSSTCQCNTEFPVFREDLNICVENIHECNAARFVTESSSDISEKIPYVFLPQRGQIIYPKAEIRFPGVKVPVCVVAGAQQLNRGGWSELRNISNAEPPFKLFRDEGRTYLQWIGDSGLRDAAEGRLVVARLVCRDADPEKLTPDVFTPCVAFRVAGSPAKNSIREVVFIADTQNSQGLSAVEYAAIGFSSVLLALIYVASVLLYLHSRKAKRKQVDHQPETGLSGPRDTGGGPGIVKNNPLLSAGRHFESDTNSGLSESEIGDDLPQSDGEQGFENITSAVIHPHFAYAESEGIFGSSSILGERLPEEDVRIVETIENAQQMEGSSSLPGTQRRKLYFNPAYFERQLLLAPPPAAIEFLFKIREVISIAKHKMAAKRFVPTLLGIPEEESANQDRGIRPGLQRRGSSAQGSVAKSRKSQGCTGCPGCRDSQASAPVVPTGIGGQYLCQGESRIRAWLEDVNLPEKRWKVGGSGGGVGVSLEVDGTVEDGVKNNISESSKNLRKSFEYLREIERRDFGSERVKNARGSIGLSYSLKENNNRSMVQSFENIARSEIVENNSDDKLSVVSKRSTRSMFEVGRIDYSRYNEAADSDAVNEKVRRAIENSFIKQMEEDAKMIDKNSSSPEIVEEQRSSTSTNSLKSSTRTASSDNSAKKRSKKQRAPTIGVTKKLPDMIKELPLGSKASPTKKLMDEVIQEMVVAKSLDHHRSPIGKRKIHEYEVDSLERSKSSIKSSPSPASTNRHSSPALSNALPLDEELTMQNAIFNVKTGAMTISKLSKNDEELEVAVPRQQSYSLVSEVYVNDGYTSPAESDCSAPEIQYEAQNPGHLTIKVVDSPDNYVKQDDSEYEPDTLDRKPMKLKINGDVSYERGNNIDEVYIDSLERPAQISLKSRGSFRNEDAPPFQRNYGSLREIYEARLRSNLKNSALLSSTRSLNGDPAEFETISSTTTSSPSSWRKNKYLTPEIKHAKRQRKPQNHPDVVPVPNSNDAIYQQPKPPRKIETIVNGLKNGWDRSRANAGSPTTSEATSVPVLINQVGSFSLANEKGRCSSCRIVRSNSVSQSLESSLYKRIDRMEKSQSMRYSPSRLRINVVSPNENDPIKANKSYPPRSMEPSRCLISDGCIKFLPSEFRKPAAKSSSSKIEDSGYLSSTDSNGSQKRLLRQEVCSVSETDETESVCDGASESGAESVGTDSVFFGNFRKLAEMSNFSKSVDSGVDLNVRNPYFQAFGIRNEGGVLERQNFIHCSDSESDSFMTVLPVGGSKRNSLVL